MDHLLLEFSPPIPSLSCQGVWLFPRRMLVSSIPFQPKSCFCLSKFTAGKLYSRDPIPQLLDLHVGGGFRFHSDLAAHFRDRVLGSFPETALLWRHLFKCASLQPPPPFLPASLSSTHEDLVRQPSLVSHIHASKSNDTLKPTYYFASQQHLSELSSPTILKYFFFLWSDTKFNQFSSTILAFLYNSVLRNSSLSFKLLEKEMATHSSILAWRIPWTEEPIRLESMQSQRLGHDWVTEHSTFKLYIECFTVWAFIYNSIKLEPTPKSSVGKWRNKMCYLHMEY